MSVDFDICEANCLCYSCVLLKKCNPCCDKGWKIKCGKFKKGVKNDK